MQNRYIRHRFRARPFGLNHPARGFPRVSAYACPLARIFAVRHITSLTIFGPEELSTNHHWLGYSPLYPQYLPNLWRKFDSFTPVSSTFFTMGYLFQYGATTLL